MGGFFFSVYVSGVWFALMGLFRSYALQLGLIKSLRQKKAHIMEIQVNGGSIADKVRVPYFSMHALMCAHTHTHTLD